MNYKDSINLMQTEFPQRANLPQREPLILERWQQMDLYGQIREKSAGKPLFVLHDGPPYANGLIHLGHALNKVLKDIVVKYKTMRGYDAPYVPGWDCHGLPIEHEVEKQLGEKRKTLSTEEFRDQCKAWAERFIAAQRTDFMRLGVTGQWFDPYLTMSTTYEAAIVRNFLSFFFQGSVYRNLRPVHWCMVHETALAEAEIEYQEHTSPSIYVGFTGLRGGEKAGLDLSGGDIQFVIWTTTPWTLPANKAIVVHPEFSYALVEASNGKRYVIASDLVEATLAAAGLSGTVSSTFPGASLAGVVTRHPFLEQESPVFLADYVTAEAGTGLVHTAPGHGQDDYKLGVREGLEIYNPVDDKGNYRADLPLFGGMHIWKANPAIIEHLRESGHLLHASTVKHQYPHSWRSKKPVIFRATNQWFISMEHNDLRAKALEWIDRVRWIPPQGRERIYSMIENRPDWCISRQRTWGVPITVFLNTETNEPLTDRTVYERVVSEIATHGVNIWFTKPVEYFLGEGYRDPATGATSFKKVMDILDVWFESGVSHDAVLNTFPGHHWPADLYLEGSDQHRGWFHSSLLAGVGVKGESPYRAVLTHGFVVDQDGKKLSKSGGNSISPQGIIGEFGADVLRVWISGEDFRTDVRLGKEILARASDSYRKIRNTARFLIGNLYDFDPAKDLLPYAQRQEIDRWILAELSSTIEKVTQGYEDYEFHLVEKALHNFCAVDLSAYYLDITRDRLYCERADDPIRRSTQSTIYEVLSVVARLWAPLCPLTAEEIWEYFPGEKRASIHLEDYPEADPTWSQPDLIKRWGRILELRGEVGKAIEVERTAKRLGGSLEAAVTVYAEAEDLAFLTALGEEFRQYCLVSKLSLQPYVAAPAEGLFRSEETASLAVHATKAAGAKCVRCWIISEELGTHPEHPELCPRCTGVMTSQG